MQNLARSRSKTDQQKPPNIRLETVHPYKPAAFKTENAGIQCLGAADKSRHQEHLYP